MSNFAAFLVGISDYRQSEGLKLDYAVNDAEKLNEIFTIYKPFEIQNNNLFLITSKSKKIPSKSNIFDLINAKMQKPYDGILFYFSGHGFSYNGIPYLMPCDYKEDENGNPILETAISIQDLIKVFNSNIGRKIFIIDACRTEWNENEALDNALRNYFLDYTDSSKYNTLLHACSFNEETYEYSEFGLSKFTHFLIESLTTQYHNISFKSYIYLGEIFDYIIEKFKYIPEHPRLTVSRADKIIVFQKPQLITEKIYSDIDLIPDTIKQKDFWKKMNEGSVDLINIKNCYDLSKRFESKVIQWGIKEKNQNKIATLDKINWIKELLISRCNDIYQEVYDDSNAFGMKIWKKLTSELRSIITDKNVETYDLNIEHLKGLICRLTDECSVWWSPKFNLEEVNDL